MIRISGSDFVDEFGRTLLLRGVNLAGSSKVPFTPNGATYLRDGFFDHRNVSFVGRPFPLAEADEHFGRLRAWGLPFLRFLVTWEAIEHAGPGIYDEAYLEYVHQIIQKAGEYGIQLFIDPHQDVWSRFTGGDGAPGWTLEAAGMDLTKLTETGAAIVHALHGDPFPRMIWPTNTHKLASATMFALFFAGNDLAPCTKIEGEPAQEYLQRHYIAAFRRLAHCVRDLPNVTGFDTMNEPMRGYMGVDDLTDCCGRPRLGEFPAPLQAMLLASGIPQEVDIWEMDLRGNRRISSRLVNPEGMRLWKDGVECIWRDNGVWDLAADGSPRLLRPNHFSQVNGKLFDFNQDYYRPFANRFAREIRAEIPGAIIFIETEPSTPSPRWSADDVQGIVYAPHWYDVVPLVLKRYYSFIAADYHTGRLVFLPQIIRRSFRSQLSKYRQESREFLRDAPVLVGEVGVPYDLNQKFAFRTGNFNVQVNALDRTFQALEDNLLNCTIWNYTPDNSNTRGDQWNDEDFSIFSRDQQWDPADVNSGGRALAALLRPYPLATAGKPVKLSFDIHKKRCEFIFDHDPQISAPTELFVPNYQFPKGYTVIAPGGSARSDPTTQRLNYTPAAPGGRHSILIFPQK